jgi:hypothetical protein
LNCLSDAIILEKRELVLVEIKGIYVRNGEKFNEFGRIHRPEKDYQTWTNQVQFSLAVSGIKKGRLIVVEDSNQEIVLDKKLKLDQDFMDANLDRFLEFYLSDILYRNSELKHVKGAVRKRIKTQVRANLDDQMEQNRIALKLKFGHSDSLKKHFGVIHARIRGLGAPQ